MTHRTKAELLHLGYIVMWWVIGAAAAIGLGQLGVHGDTPMGVCTCAAMAIGIVVSKPRRQHIMQIVRSAQGRVSQLRRNRHERRARIVRPPVSRLDRVAQLLWSAQTYERVFKPARADVLHEWQQAEAAGDLRRARLIKHVLGPASMLQHMIAQLPVSFLKLVAKLWAAAR